MTIKSNTRSKQTNKKKIKHNHKKYLTYHNKHMIIILRLKVLFFHKTIEDIFSVVFFCLVNFEES